MYIMFDADDVDVDLFTPASSSSLASIFKVSQTKNKNETASLKYTPESPPSLTKVEEKPEDAKPTECIFACASNVYEWANNTYVNKGILGFGIIKFLKNGIHNFVLYNANKTTLSHATFSPTFTVHVKKSSCISYYDNAQKYWNIYAKENEIEKIMEILKQLNISVKHSQQENPLTKYVNTSVDSQDTSNTKEKSTEDKSDTDSSINKRTKDSIIKRMASMGHSVLPYTKTNLESTDSSDSSEMIDHRRHTKHKINKSTPTHNNNEKNIQEEVDGKVCTTKSVANNKISYNTNPNVHRNPTEIVPCSSLEIVNNKKSEIPTLGMMSDVSILISEQRVSNSELRINMNRISDKLDMVMSKINENSNADRECSVSNYQNIIVQKLLSEYETKIKKYEECIQSNDLDNKIMKNNMDYNVGCKDIGESREEKAREILKLEDEITKLNQQCHNFEQKEKFYMKEISDLKNKMEKKDEQLVNLNKKVEDSSKNLMMQQKDGDAKDEIKSLMNDTFQAIAANFTNEESYSGSKVKSIVAAVIKKTTMESINNL